MQTLTELEDKLRKKRNNINELLAILAGARQRLQETLDSPGENMQYQRLTLLLEAVIQAEDIIKIINFRYRRYKKK